MNIIVIKDKLKEVVDILSRVSINHPTLNILKNVLIEAKGDVIKCSATNLEIGVECRLPGKVVEIGSVTVPADLLGQIVNNLSEDRITLAAKGQSLEVVTDNYHAKIEGASPDEFPLIPRIKNLNEYIEIDAGVLKDVLEKTLAATQFSELRPELNSVLIRFSTDALVFAATDSFRLAEKTLNESQFKSNITKEFSALIPLKTAQEVVRVLKKGEVKIVFEENQVFFKIGDIELISHLLQGNFPDYKAIIPKDFQAEVLLDRGEFMNAVKLTSAFGSAAAETCLKPSKKGIEVFSRSEKVGENTYALPAKIKGELPEISFNWKYLLDGIKTIDSKDVALRAGEESRPAMLKASQDSSYFYIVMPILKG